MKSDFCAKVRICASIVLTGMSATILADTRHFKPSSTAGWASPDSYEEGTVPSKASPSEYSWIETVVIPEGATVDVNDADWSIFKICQIRIEKDATLRMNITSALGGDYYGFGYNQLGGSGTIEKTGSFLMLTTQYNASFSGNWVIDQGGAGFIYQVNSAGNQANKVYVRDGAWVDESQYGNYGSYPNFTLGQTTFHIAGDGESGKGAILSGSYTAYNKTTYKRIILDADASMSAYNGGIGLHGTADKPAFLDLAGHDLSIKGGIYASSVRACGLSLQHVLVTNSVPGSGGRIILGGPNSSSHYLEIRDGVVFDKNVTLVTQKGGVVRVHADAGGAVTTVAANLQATLGGSAVVLSTLTSGASNGSVNWTGNVEIPAGKTFNVPGSTAGETFTISGNLTGGGTVKIDNQNEVSLTGDNSGFSGSLTINDFYNWTGLRFGNPSSAPSDPSKITLQGSTLVVPFPAWTFSQYLALANGATFEDSGVYLPSVTIDPSACPESTYTLNVESGEVTNGKIALGVGGEGTVKVGALPADERLNFAAWAGTLSFAESSPIALGTLLATSFRNADHPGTILFDGANVDISSNCVWIGTPYLVSANAKGAVVVTNATIVNHQTRPLYEKEGFYVGHAGYGRLLFEDSVVTSRVHVGVEANGVGEFIVKGGRFCNWGGGNSAAIKDMLVAGHKGHGYIEFDHAAVEVTGYVALGRDGGGSGVLVQKGGTCFQRLKPNETSTTPTQLHVGCRKGTAGARTVGQYRLTGGGQASVMHDTYVAAIGNDGTYDKYTYATFTVDGVGSRYQSGPFGIGEGKMSTGIVNLNDGGTLYAKTFRGTSATREGKGYLNFNGGIYEHRGWGQQYLFGLKADAANEYDRAITRVTVYGKGAKIVSVSSHKDRKFGQPIHNATGKGVGAVPWTSLTEFCGAPAVIIEGDGFGASAMADYDAERHVVTNITVTSPGCDYTEATAYIVQANVTNAVIGLTADLVDNDETGPVEFRFTDVGSFIFDVANDYKGETTLSSVYWDACFNITNKDAFAKSKAIKLKGGILYLAGYTLDDLTAPFKFMGGRVTGAAGSYVIPEGKMVVDLNDIIAGEKYSVANNTNLTLPDKIALWNATDLDEKAKYTLLTLPKGYSGKDPTFTGVPANWHVSRLATSYRLGYDKGTVLILR